jgi:hypothetical protein
MPGSTAESISSLPSFSSAAPLRAPSYDARAGGSKHSPKRGALLSPESGSAILNHPTTSIRD